MAQADTKALVEDIEQIRQRLADDVDQLLDRSHPKNLAKRAADDIKSRFVADDGSPRFENIVPLAAGTLAVLGALITIRRLLR